MQWNAQKIALILGFTSSLFVSHFSLAQPGRFWNCTNRVNGTWAFGQAPDACDVSAFGSEDKVKKTYQSVVFNDGDQNSANTYMNSMYAVLRDGARAYLKARNPQSAVTK